MATQSRQAAFLITPGSAHNDNHQRLPVLLEKHGWSVLRSPHDALNGRHNGWFLDDQPVEKFDLIWPVGLGPKTTYLDRIQLLMQLPQWQLINQATVYHHLHGKAAWFDYMPPTCIAADASTLIKTFETDGGDWIIKPVAGSFGQHVERIYDADDIRRMVDELPGRYWMLQKFLPEITSGETRTLVCGQLIIGSYLRIPTDNLHANLAAHATIQTTELNRSQQALVNTIHDQLFAAGVGYAAIDIVGNHLMEVNVANPGGLATLTELYGPQVESRFLAAIDTELQRRAKSS